MIYLMFDTKLQTRSLVMDQVWVVTHAHEFDDGHEDLKIIGVFSTQDAAEAALRQVKDQPGFREFPEGFDVSAWKLDRIGWTHGFVTIDPDDAP